MVETEERSLIRCTAMVGMYFCLESNDELYDISEEHEKRSLQISKARTYSRMHPEAFIAAREPMDYFNKTALMLPNYLAQISHRSLKKSGRHSDVGVEAYTRPEVCVDYDISYVPSSILQQFFFDSSNWISGVVA